MIINKKTGIKKLIVASVLLVSQIFNAHAQEAVYGSHLCNPFINSADMAASENIRNDAVSQALFENVDIEETPYLLVGDTGHADPRTHEFFYQTEVIHSLADSGVRHLFLERDLSQQYLVDGLMAGDLTKEEFAQQLRRTPWISQQEDMRLSLDLANTILEAHKRDIRVHFIAAAQERIGAQTLHELFDFIADMRDQWMQSCPDQAYMTMDFVRNYQFDYRYDARRSRGNIARMNEYISNNEPLVSLLSELSQGQPFAIFIGSAHLHGERGVINLLGPANTRALSLYFDEYAAVESNSGAAGADERNAAAYYIINRRALYRP